MIPRIYVALSGGVDSAVAAALLKRQGYEVVGVYMKNWADDFGISADCPWEKDVEDVKKVAEHLGIEWKVFNFEKEYKERILDYFFAEYKAGRTPNPDILCNNLIKFDLFAQRAFAEGATHIATGHYARRQSSQGFPWETQGELGLFTALDPQKDQCYFLQRLSSDQLNRALFPLGGYYKQEVRAMALDLGLPNAQKKDSQGICFIGDIDVRDFIRQHLSNNPGNIIESESGRVVGKHQGLWFYTIGQRQGIGVSSPDIPYYVVEKRKETNELVIAKGRENKLLRKQKLTLGALHSISGQFHEGQAVQVSLRYRENPIPAVIEEINNSNAVIVSQSNKGFWAPALGQGGLFYKNENVDKLAEKSDVEKNSDVLYKYFTDSGTRSRVRCLQVLGSGVVEGANE